MKEYLSFITRFLLAFGLIFQMPLLAFFFTRIGMVNHKALAKFRRYALVINFLIAAILTPTPDLVNQLLMAGPLLVLYEVSILVSRFSAKKEEGEEAKP
jgi:sec-independent protein translocase protein TatC